MILDSSVLAGPDQRRTAILGAAFAAFGRYGYRRTSMEDIARASGLSRTALYLHFQNKQDILRSLTQTYFEVTEGRMRAALVAGGKPKHCVAAAFEAKLGPELVALLDSPHGAELLDHKTSEAADEIARGEARLVAVLADWLRIESAAGRITLSPFGADPPNLAQMMIAAVAGQVALGPSVDQLRANTRALALVFARALKP